jgi:acetyltransferase-like isoleucine patch superfamily enzyme
MWGRIDNQEVGLEAATLERVRNSSLVKWFRADNVAGLKHTAEAVALTHYPAGPCRVGSGVWVGRGASCIR